MAARHSTTTRCGCARRGDRQLTPAGLLRPFSVLPETDVVGDRLGFDSDFAQQAGDRIVEADEIKTEFRSARIDAAGARLDAGLEEFGIGWAVAGGEEIASKSLCRPSTKRAPPSDISAMSGATLIAPSRILPMVPTSITGMRDARDICSSNPCLGRLSPYFSSLPNTRSRMIGNTASLTRRGPRRVAMLTTWMGTPSSSRGTIWTPPRTEIVGCAPPSARSSAISAPVLPMPMTSTDWPANGVLLR